MFLPVYIRTKLNYLYSYLLQDTKTNSIISETSNKIDIEIASLKTLMESNKLETIRYLAGKPVRERNYYHLTFRPVSSYQVMLASTGEENGGAITGFLNCLVPAVSKKCKFHRQ